jgi:uncharacterized RDD family membrane protein YckC
VAPAYPVAGMGRRIVAALLDVGTVVVLATVAYVGFVLSRYDEVPVPKAASGSSDACDFLDPQYASCITIGRNVYVSAVGPVDGTPFVLVIGLLVLVVLQGLTGATPGKLLTGLRVVGPDGRPPGLLRALARTAAWIVDGFPWPFPIVGWLVAVCNKRRRRIGDLVGGTVVVRKRAVVAVSPQPRH